MQLYFARHGQSEANLLHEFSNRGRKHPLTALGREQVEALAQSLRDAGIAKIYASPLLRATETAEILSERLGIPYEVAPGLAEHDVGILEGKSDPESWLQQELLWAEWFERGNHDAKIEEGESLNDLRARFMSFVESLQPRHADDTLLLIAHGGVYTALLPMLCPNLTRDFITAHPLENCGYALVNSNGGMWHCESWAGAACP